MSPPLTTITRAELVVPERLRLQYAGITSLSESIFEHGLIQPIILDGSALNAGGRRLAALDELLTQGRWDGILHHGATCLTNPLRPGFVMKGEPGTELSNLLTELAENLDRLDMTWQEEMRAIVKAGRLVRRTHPDGHLLTMRDLGAIVGCGYQDYRCAEAVVADIEANPGDYVSCTNVRSAYQTLLKKNQKAMEAELVARSIVKVQNVPSSQKFTIVADGVPTETEVLGYAGRAEPLDSVNIPLTSHFHNVNSLQYLALREAEWVDHIICDPDFAISVDRLEAGTAGAAEGVVHESVEDSLQDLKIFLPLAYRAIRSRGFLAFFYDLDHHEKLQAWATGAGFAVQRWPITWHKTDYNSNAAPTFNTGKDMEWIMLCRKGGTLNKVEKSVWPLPSGGAAKKFNHPFAKPDALWKRLFTLLTAPGQSVFDPFAGRGSCPTAALSFGLEPYGCELQLDHYNGLLLNMQEAYRAKYGQNVTFA